LDHIKDNEPKLAGMYIDPEAVTWVKWKGRKEDAARGLKDIAKTFDYHHYAYIMVC
jgi:hypothetical protein